jgi:hypothetical protein
MPIPVTGGSRAPGPVSPPHNLSARTPDFPPRNDSASNASALDHGRDFIETLVGGYIHLLLREGITLLVPYSPYMRPLFVDQMYFRSVPTPDVDHRLSEEELPPAHGLVEVPSANWTAPTTSANPTPPHAHTAGFDTPPDATGTDIRPIIQAHTIRARHNANHRRQLYLPTAPNNQAMPTPSLVLPACASTCPEKCKGRIANEQTTCLVACKLYHCDQPEDERKSISLEFQPPQISEGPDAEVTRTIGGHGMPEPSAKIGDAEGRNEAWPLGTHVEDEAKKGEGEGKGMED